MNKFPRKQHANTHHILDPEYRYNSVTDISHVIYMVYCEPYGVPNAHSHIVKNFMALTEIYIIK